MAQTMNTERFHELVTGNEEAAIEVIRQIRDNYPEVWAKAMSDQTSIKDMITDHTYEWDPKK